MREDLVSNHLGSSRAQGLVPRGSSLLLAADVQHEVSNVRPGAFQMIPNMIPYPFQHLHP